MMNPKEIKIEIKKTKHQISKVKQMNKTGKSVAWLYGYIAGLKKTLD